MRCPRRQTRECRARPGRLAVNRSSAGLHVGIGQPPRVGARRQQGDVPQQRFHGAQVHAQLGAIGRAAAARAGQQVFRSFDPPPRIGRRRRVRQNLPGHVACLHEVVGAGFERAAQAAVRRRGHGACGRLGLAACDQRAGDLVRRQRTEVEARAARTDRRQEHVRARGHEDEDGHRGRLFERFQQGVLGGWNERVGFVDDDHAPPALERAIRRAVDGLAHLFDLDRAGVAGLENEDVGVDAAGDARARGAGAARVSGRPPVRNGLKAVPYRCRFRVGDGL